MHIDNSSQTTFKIRWRPRVCLRSSYLGPVAAEVRSRMATKHSRSNCSFHWVLACNAGGPGFDSPLRRNILRCSMQEDVDGSGQASTVLPYPSPVNWDCDIGSPSLALLFFMTSLTVRTLGNKEMSSILADQWRPRIWAKKLSILIIDMSPGAGRGGLRVSTNEYTQYSHWLVN